MGPRPRRPAARSSIAPSPTRRRSRATTTACRAPAPSRRMARATPSCRSRREAWETRSRENVMTELSRRGVLTGTVAAAAAVLAPLDGRSPARAAAPPAGKQAPGYYRYKVGSIEVTVVTDGARTAPVPDTYVKNAKREDFSAG